MENHVAVSLQVDGRDFQREAVRHHLQVAVFALREGDVGIQMDGQPQPAGHAGEEGGAGVGGHGETAVLSFEFQPVQPHGKGIRRQAAA